MKKSTMYLIILFVSLNFFPANAMITGTDPGDKPKTEVPAEVKVMMNRLEEIKAMDKSDLSSSERKALRKEVRAIKAELRTSNGGVYLSVGAIIIIILLLILIL